MMGGTSRGAEFLVAVGVAGVVDEDVEDVGEEGDDSLELCDSLLVEDVVESGVALFPSAVLLLVLVLLSSAFREMPKRLSISSLRRPLDSRNATLRSTGASRMESSCKNLLACSMSSERGVSSEFGDGVEVELLVLVLAAAGCCH
jgi:hypothetical protein